jgi:hypothetical protein
MIRKVVFIYLFVFISSININAQSVSVKGVIHADTVQINTPFSLSFYFVNTGIDTLFMDSITANVGISPHGMSPMPIQMYFLLNIPQSIFAPGDSILFLDPQIPMLALSAGDHIVTIWPSSIVPIITDTSITDIHIISTISNISENLTQNIGKFKADIYDLNGRKYDNINSIPTGLIYIRDSKKYIKIKE